MLPLLPPTSLVLPVPAAAAARAGEQSWTSAAAAAAGQVLLPKHCCCCCRCGQHCCRLMSVLPALLQTCWPAPLGPLLLLLQVLQVLLQKQG
jgi:hypothetical protein